MLRRLFSGAVILVVLALMGRAWAADPELVIRFSTQAPPNGSSSRP